MCSETADTSAKEIIKELEVCERQHGSMTKEVNSFREEMNSLGEIDRLSFETKLFSIQTKCEELGDSLVRLKEDHKLATEREGRITSRYAKLREVHHHVVSEKNKTIAELKVNLSDVKDQINAKDEIVEMCTTKIRQRDMRLQELERELQIILQQKLAAEETINELREFQLGFCQTVKELKQKNLESNQTIEELKQKNMESNQTMEELRRSNLEACQTVEDLKRRQWLPNEERSKIQNLASRVTRVEEEISSFLGCNLDDLNFIQKSSATVENDKLTLPHSKGEKQSNGCGNTLNTDSADVQILATTSPGAQSAFHFSDTEYKNLPRRDIVEVIDIDDEANYVGADDVANVCLKRKRSIDEFDDCGTLHKGKEIEDSKGLEDSDNESCSDSCINAILESCKNWKPRKTWMFGTDLRNAFYNDDNLCMNAVCALYRQENLSPQSTEDFYHFNAMRGHDLAKYLIDGDPCLKLRKSISEVRHECPDVIVLCRKLAVDYYEKLFSIYCTRKDPFFN